MTTASQPSAPPWSVKNPSGPASGTKRVIRSAAQPRASRDPKEHSDQIGFRIVIESLNAR